MESQVDEKQLERQVWAVYHQDWLNADSQERAEITWQIKRWQELMNSGVPPSQAWAIVGQKSHELSTLKNAVEWDKVWNEKASEASAKQPAVTSGPRKSKRPIIFMGLALVAAIVYGSVITVDRDNLNVELTAANVNLASVEAELTPTKNTLATAQAELGTIKKSLDVTRSELSTTSQKLASTDSALNVTKQSLTSKQTELTLANQQLSSFQSELLANKTRMDAIDTKLKLYEDTMGIKIYASVQPGTQRGDLSVMHLNNVVTAANPSWQQLKSFLLADQTDDRIYRANSFDCVDFAEMLHNNAEAAGIKAAYVELDFLDNPIGHAINAFVTTDRGLVFVDNTGAETFDSSVEHDKIGYVIKSKEYGSISLDQSTPFDYAYYEKRKADYNSFSQKLKAYNLDVSQYNREISGRVYTVGTAEWMRIKETQRTLETRRLDLLAMEAQLNDFWPPTGIVRSITIYW